MNWICSLERKECYSQYTDAQTEVQTNNKNLSYSHMTEYGMDIFFFILAIPSSAQELLLLVCATMCSNPGLLHANQMFQLTEQAPVPNCL